MLNSGTGYFGYIDLKRGQFEPVAFCPGYSRGLDFVGNFALVGLSSIRDNKTFSGLLLDDNLQQFNVKARCGVQVIDLTSGDVVHSLNISGVVQELYDVLILPQVTRPMAIGITNNEICRSLRIKG